MEYLINLLMKEEEEKEKKRRAATRRYNQSEKRKAAVRRYNHSKKRKAAVRRYNHSEKRRDTRRKYTQSVKGKAAHKRASDKPRIKLTTKLQGRLNSFLIKGRDTQLNRETMGCTLNELRTRFTILFRTGMTWENHGEWEFDHIIPTSKFDLSKDEEVKKCMHYTNLQPLWKWENKLKGNK